MRKAGFDLAPKVWEMTPLSQHSFELAAPQSALGITSENSFANPLPPPVLSTGPTPWALLAALKRRWFLALGLGLTAALLGALTVWFLPLTWRVRTLLHIAEIRPYILNQLSDSKWGYVNSRTQLSLVKSRLVLLGALNAPEVASLPSVRSQSQPVEWLEKQLQVDFNLGPEILSIAVTTDNQDTVEEWVKILTAVRNSYVLEIVNKEQNDRLKRQTELQKIFDTNVSNLKERLAQQEQESQGLGSKKSSTLQLKLKALYDHESSLRGELIKEQSHIRTLRNDVIFLERKLKSAQEGKVPEEVIDERLAVEPEFARLRSAVDMQKEKLREFRSALSDPEGSAPFQREKEALATAQRAVDKRRTELRPLVVQQLKDATVTESKLSLNVKKEELGRALDDEKALTELLNKKVQEIESVMKGTSTLENLDEQIAPLVETNKRIGNMIEALKVELSAPSRISILEETIPTQTRSKTDRFRLMAMVSLGLFGAVIVAIAFLEFTSRRVSGVGEVTQGLGLRLLGVLPSVPAPAWGGQLQRVPSNRWQRMLKESVDSARTMLVHLVEHEGLKTVLVTSAVKGEGKTLLCSHLAVSMAQSGYKTLLIDADFRHPAIHRQFGLPRAPGISEVLRGRTDADSALHLELVPDLTILTAGQWDQSMLDALAQKQRIASVLDKFRGDYDFILIDTAPVLVAPDTLMLSQHVDGALFSVLRGVSRLPLIYSACERMAMLGVRILGAVMGRASVNSGYAYQYEAVADQ